MVNTGKPSRACLGCRAIKSKCDEAMPSCRRCARKAKPCVYPNANPYFVSMNAWTEKNVQARVESKTATRALQGTQCLQIYPPSPSKLVSIDWSSHAIGPFFDRFVVQPDHLCSGWGFLPWLPQIYGDHSVPKYLVEATNACALANLANVSKIQQLETLASRSYGIALMGLHKAFCEPETATSNDSLSAMMLLALYEIISGSPTPRKELFQAHLKGQSTIIRLRAKESTLSNIDSSVIAHTNRWLLWRDLGGRRCPTLGLAEWPADTYRSWLDELSARLTVRTADLCGRVRELQEHPSAFGQWALDEELVSCVNTAFELEQSFKLSFASAPQKWLPVRGTAQQALPSALQDNIRPEFLSNLECPMWRIWEQEHVGGSRDYNFESKPTKQEAYLPRIDTYPSRPVALLWNYMRCNRLHILRVMVDLHLMTSKRLNHYSCDLPSIDDISTRISETIHDICASIPFLIGDFCAGISDQRRVDMAAVSESCSGTGAATLWILHKVCDVPSLSPAVKAWVLDVFERVGTVGNIRQGINLKKLYGQRYTNPVTG